MYGADNRIDAAELTIGSTSYPTPNAGLTVETGTDAAPGEEYTYGYDRTAWWKLEVDEERQVVFDMRLSTPPGDGVDAYVDIYRGSIFTPWVDLDWIAGTGTHDDTLVTVTPGTYLLQAYVYNWGADTPDAELCEYVVRISSAYKGPWQRKLHRADVTYRPGQSPLVTYATSTPNVAPPVSPGYDGVRRESEFAQNFNTTRFYTVSGAAAPHPEISQKVWAWARHGQVPGLYWDYDTSSTKSSWLPGEAEGTNVFTIGPNTPLPPDGKSIGAGAGQPKGASWVQYQPAPGSFMLGDSMTWSWGAGGVWLRPDNSPKPTYYVPGSEWPEGAIDMEMKGDWTTWRSTGRDEGVPPPIEITDLTLTGWGSGLVVGGVQPASWPDTPITMYLRNRPRHMNSSSSRYDGGVNDPWTNGVRTSDPAAIASDPETTTVARDERVDLSTQWFTDLLENPPTDFLDSPGDVQIRWMPDAVVNDVWLGKYDNTYYIEGEDGLYVSYTVGYYSAPYRFTFVDYAPQSVPGTIIGGPLGSNRRFKS